MNIDLNADVGEGFGAWRMGDDEGLIKVLSSVNVACGYHAGDAEIMARTVRLARASGCEIGAHIGLPDLLGFGRRRMRIDGRTFAGHVLYQIGALQAIAIVEGHKVTHFSFHGALGDMAAEDEELAMCLLEAVASFDRELTVSTSPGTMTMKAAKAIGIRSVGIFAADRNYRSDGKLVSRKEPNSLIKDPVEVAARATRLVKDGMVSTIDGRLLPMPARTVMVHGDTENAVTIAVAIRDAIEACKGNIVPLSRLARLEDGR